MDLAERFFRELEAISDGELKVVELPDDMKPTAEGLERLDEEIRIKVQANQAIENRSYIYASKCNS